MPTTIQISDDVRTTLEKMKMFERETYNEILERMIEDEKELTEQTKKEIEESRRSKRISHEEVKRKFGIR
jgi:predicted CopG family antitoxin